MQAMPSRNVPGAVRAPVPPSACQWGPGHVLMTWRHGRTRWAHPAGVQPGPRWEVKGPRHHPAAAVWYQVIWCDVVWHGEAQPARHM